MGVPRVHIIRNRTSLRIDLHAIYSQQGRLFYNDGYVKSKANILRWVGHIIQAACERAKPLFMMLVVFNVKLFINKLDMVYDMLSSRSIVIATTPRRPGLFVNETGKV